jgi:hypothetical protein
MQRDVPRITDFGIGGITSETAARQAGVTGMMSTRTAAAACGGYSLYYASPEQVRGAPRDPRDDVHALGVIWYQLLVGDLTAEAPRGPGWKKRLAAKGMSAELIEFLEACTASDREDRPVNAGEVAEQIGLMGRDQLVAHATTAPSTPHTAINAERVADLPSEHSTPPTHSPLFDADSLRNAANAISTRRRKDKLLCGLRTIRDTLHAQGDTTSGSGNQATTRRSVRFELALFAGVVAGLIWAKSDGDLWLGILKNSRHEAYYVAPAFGTLVFTLLWRGSIWLQRRRTRHRARAVHDTIASLHSEFPTEMAAFGDIDLRDPIAVQEVVKEVESRLALSART